MRRATLTVKTYHAARKAAPWAAVCAKVEGGYIAFESMDDYTRFKRQR